MHLKPENFIALGAFILAGLTYMKVKRKWVPIVLVIFGVASVIASILSPKDAPTDSHNQVATTSGDNSPAVNQPANVTGTNNSINQIAPVTQVMASSNVMVKNDSENPVINAEGMSGNLLVQIGGSNNSATQTFVNTGPIPTITTLTRSLNFETNIAGLGKAYLTTILVRVHNPPNHPFMINWMVDHPIRLLEPASSSHAGGITEAGVVTMDSTAVTFVSPEKLQDSNFHFYIIPTKH